MAANISRKQLAANAKTSILSSSTATFPQFLKLPIEIRHIIWSFVLSNLPRVVEIRFTEHLYPDTSVPLRLKPNSLLSSGICQEARRDLLRLYSLERSATMADSDGWTNVAQHQQLDRHLFYPARGDIAWFETAQQAQSLAYALSRNRANLLGLMDVKNLWIEKLIVDVPDEPPEISNTPLRGFGGLLMKGADHFPQMKLLVIRDIHYRTATNTSAGRRMNRADVTTIVEHIRYFLKRHRKLWPNLREPLVKVLRYSKQPVNK